MDFPSWLMSPEFDWSHLSDLMIPQEVPTFDLIKALNKLAEMILVGTMILIRMQGYSRLV